MPMGHNANTITSANSVILFRCNGIYDNFVKIEGAQADSFLSFGDATFTESQVGVDGKQSIGYVPHLTPITLTLAANSASIQVIENVYNDFVANSEARYCEFQITYPATKRRRTLKGTITTKNGGGISRLLDGHTYNFSMIDSGFENI